MNRVGCWDINPSALRALFDGYTTCGPDDPGVDEVVDFVNPITRTVCHLAVPVPYERFAAAWPALEAWLTKGWRAGRMDPTSLVFGAAMTPPGGEG